MTILRRSRHSGIELPQCLLVHSDQVRFLTAQLLEHQLVYAQHCLAVLRLEIFRAVEPVFQAEDRLEERSALYLVRLRKP